MSDEDYWNGRTGQPPAGGDGFNDWLRGQVDLRREQERAAEQLKPWAGPPPTPEPWPPPPPPPQPVWQNAPPRPGRENTPPADWTGLPPAPANTPAPSAPPAPREIAALVVAAGFVALLFWLGLVMKAIGGAVVAVLAAVVLALFGGLVVMVLGRPLARIAPPTYRVAYQVSACAIAVYIWTVWMSMLIVEHLGWGGLILQLAAWAHTTLNLTGGRMGAWYTYFALAQLPGLLACAGVLSGTLEGRRGLAGYGKACLLSIPLIALSLAVAVGWAPVIRQVISGQG